mmetsp:Transcript_11885/g.35877  ORF Transcript_11885/g.35877 Transcript_11885/m.35877 type:complete len:252 (-) Transcript_11885:146-901(-)
MVAALTQQPHAGLGAGAEGSLPGRHQHAECAVRERGLSIRVRHAAATPRLGEEDHTCPADEQPCPRRASEGLAQEDAAEDGAPERHGEASDQHIDQGKERHRVEHGDDGPRAQKAAAEQHGMARGTAEGRLPVVSQHRQGDDKHDQAPDEHHLQHGERRRERHALISALASASGTAARAAFQKLRQADHAREAETAEDLQQETSQTPSSGRGLLGGGFARLLLGSRAQGRYLLAALARSTLPPQHLRSWHF